MIAHVDRRSLARNQRRRAIADALAEEEGRESALVAQLEETVAEVESPALDEEIFARMDPEDVEIVRAALHAPTDWSLGLNDFPAGWAPEDDEPDEESPEEEQRTLADEIHRLEEAIEQSRRRRRALERYAAALDA
jgi:hypothetical protein